MRDIFKDYDSLEVPAPLEMTTFPEAGSVIRERGEEFFVKIRSSLGMAATKFDSIFNTQFLMTNKGQGYPEQHDTELMTLRFGGLQTLGTVLDERDDFNIHVVSFLKSKLRDGVRRDIERIHKELVRW